MPDTADALVAALRQALGAAAVLSSEAQADEHARYLSDWRQRYHGRARAIARPASTEEVATVVRLCAQHGATIVPQGGNTGLVGGSVPDASIGPELGPVVSRQAPMASKLSSEKPSESIIV